MDNNNTQFTTKVKLDKYEVIDLAWWFYRQRQKGYDFSPTSKKWLDFLHPKTVEEVYELLQNQLKNRNYVEIIKRI